MNSPHYGSRDRQQCCREFPPDRGRQVETPDRTTNLLNLLNLLARLWRAVNELPVEVRGWVIRAISDSHKQLRWGLNPRPARQVSNAHIRQHRNCPIGWYRMPRLIPAGSRIRACAGQSYRRGGNLSHPGGRRDEFPALRCGETVNIAVGSFFPTPYSPFPVP